jgi:hypothetical protein
MTVQLGTVFAVGDIFEARLTHRLRSLELRLNHRALHGRLVRSDYAHPGPDVVNSTRSGRRRSTVPGKL